LVFLAVAAGAVGARAQDADAVSPADVAGAQLKFTRVNPKTAGQTGTDQATLPGVAGIDSLVNFSGAYSTPGIGPNGKPQNDWIFNTVGNAPSKGGTTTLNAPIVPVSLDFRNADGSPRYVRVVNGKPITCGTPGYLTIPVKNGTLCCIGGFHSLDFEAGDANNGKLPRLFVMNYSTWDQPIFRDPTVLDVTGLSHEISEIYNDPFVAFDGVHDVTPWWLAPNGNCQNDLEVGDVVEGLPHQVFPMTMPNGFTYHPQNEALLQWFEFQSPSTGINGAYSYPDITTLTTLSAPQKAGCAP